MRGERTTETRRTQRITEKNYSVALRALRVSVVFLVFLPLSSCEEVIDIDLNSAKPEFVVEAIIYKDSIPAVRLSQTTSYFSDEEPSYVEDAIVEISDGTTTEELSYSGNGYYYGSSITGVEGQAYSLKIRHNNLIYEASSYLPKKTELIYVAYYKGNTVSPLNPMGETIITISCRFEDNPAENNFYMLRFEKEGKLFGDAFYLMTEEGSNIGQFNIKNDTISFEESIFYEGTGEVEIQLLSIDESVFNYFWQLNDILFWKRRFLPPTPYNPESNVNNGALGYFAAWSLDYEMVVLE